jgi:hypothetical protein
LHLQRTVGDLVEYGGIKQLDIGILEDKRDAPAEIQGEFVLLKVFLRESLALKLN